MKYKMKFFGSVTGGVSGHTRHFDKGQIIEAPEGEFNEATAEAMPEAEKREVEVSEGKKAETQSFKNPGKKR